MSDACPTTATAAAAAAAAVSPGYGSAAAAVVSLCVSREIDISRYLRVICHPRAKRAAKFFTIFRRYLPQEALILRYDICLDRRGYVATTQERMSRRQVERRLPELKERVRHVKRLGFH